MECAAAGHSSVNATPERPQRSGARTARSPGVGSISPSAIAFAVGGHGRQHVALDDVVAGAAGLRGVAQPIVPVAAAQAVAPGAAVDRVVAAAAVDHVGARAAVELLAALGAEQRVGPSPPRTRSKAVTVSRWAPSAATPATRSTKNPRSL